jgi:general secretion pathway protein N
MSGVLNLHIVLFGFVALLSNAANAADVTLVAAAELSAAPMKPVDAAEPRPASANPLARLSLDDLSATRDRPRFSAKRRPPAPPPRVEPVVAHPYLPRYHLQALF